MIKYRFFNSDLSKNSDCKTVFYNNGIFIIINFNKKNTFDTIFSYINSIASKYWKCCHWGVSNVFQETEYFNTPVKQTFYAQDLSYLTENNTMYYRDLGTYKVLYPNKEASYIKEFCDEILLPLTKYDEKYKTELIKTIEVYLKNDGNYKKTALDMNQHENTIRYRIMSSKKILNLENNSIKFIEQVSVALKIKSIISYKNR